MPFLANARKKLRVLAQIYFVFAVILLCAVPVTAIVAAAVEEVYPLIGAGGGLVLGLCMLIASLMLQAKVECYEDVHNIAQAVANGSLTQASQTPQSVEKALNETELPEI